MARRLPVYLLLDTSGSMSGDPIQAVENGLKTMQTALRRDPHALETACISVIEFGNNGVTQSVPLTEVGSFQAPPLRPGGGTPMGEALKKVSECADREVVKNTPDSKGDWKPLVFLMTDGMPTDSLEPGLQEFKKRKWGIVVACGAGSSVDTATLQKIAGENVVTLDVTDSNAIAAFFKWVSSSVSAGSAKVDGGKELGQLGELPPPPPQIKLAKN